MIWDGDSQESPGSSPGQEKGYSRVRISFRMRTIAKFSNLWYYSLIDMRYQTFYSLFRLSALFAAV